MNINDASLYLPFVTALTEGKTIQQYLGGSWRDVSDPDFLAVPADYRIKAIPVQYRRYLYWQSRETHVCGVLNYNNKTAADNTGNIINVESAPNFIRWVDANWMIEQV